MNEGAFLNNLNYCKKILAKYEIIKRINHRNLKICTYKKYSKDFREYAQKGEYTDAFIMGIQMDDYDYLLSDGSFLQFSFDEYDNDYTLRMAYYPSINTLSYSDFLFEFYEIEIEECGGVFIDDYQQYLSEQETKSVTPIRYDYNTKIYKHLLHSASHIHFGYEENVRVPIDKILYPSAFVKIIMQYYYYDIWKEKILQEEFSSCIIEKSENKLMKKEFFDLEEMKIPYISIQR